MDTGFQNQTLFGLTTGNFDVVNVNLLTASTIIDSGLTKSQLVATDANDSLISVPMTDGQILIGNTLTSSYQTSTLTSGSSNFIITNGGGSISQDISQNLNLTSVNASSLNSATGVFTNTYVNNITGSVGNFQNFNVLNLSSSNFTGTNGFITNLGVNNITGVSGIIQNLSSSNFTGTNINCSSITGNIGSFKNIIVTAITGSTGTFTGLITTNITGTNATFSNITGISTLGITGFSEYVTKSVGMTLNNKTIVCSLAANNRVAASSLRFNDDYDVSYGKNLLGNQNPRTGDILLFDGNMASWGTVGMFSSFTGATGTINVQNISGCQFFNGTGVSDIVTLNKSQQLTNKTIVGGINGNLISASSVRFSNQYDVPFAANLGGNQNPFPNQVLLCDANNNCSWGWQSLSGATGSLTSTHLSCTDITGALGTFNNIQCTNITGTNATFSNITGVVSFAGTGIGDYLTVNNVKTIKNKSITGGINGNTVIGSGLRNGTQWELLTGPNISPVGQNPTQSMVLSMDVSSNISWCYPLDNYPNVSIASGTWGGCLPHSAQGANIFARRISNNSVLVTAQNFPNTNTVLGGPAVYSILLDSAIRPAWSAPGAPVQLFLNGTISNGRVDISTGGQISIYEISSGTIPTLTTVSWAAWSVMYTIS